MKSKTSLKFAAATLCFGIALSVLFNCAHKPAPTLEEQSQADLEYDQAQIRSVVKDPERAEKLAGEISGFEKLLLARATAVKAYNSKIEVLNSKYSATRADYEVLIAQNDKDRSLFLQQAIAVRTQMAALTTDEEWEQLKNMRLRAMEDSLKGTL
jgi:hypothetical protein